MQESGSAPSIPRNLHAKTGRRPDQLALALARDLATMTCRTRSLRQAAGRIALVEALDDFLAPWLRQPTRGPLAGGSRPWHYAHRTARSAWRTLHRHARTRDVFTWLDPAPQTACDRPIPPTTNDIEDGINAPLKDLRRRHRGLPAHRQRILTDWHLALPTENPPDPVQFLLNPQPDQPRHAHKATDFGV